MIILIINLGMFSPLFICLSIYFPTYLPSYLPIYLPVQLLFLISYLPTYVIPTFSHTQLLTYLHTYTPSFFPIYLSTYTAKNVEVCFTYLLEPMDTQAPHIVVLLISGGYVPRPFPSGCLKLMVVPKPIYILWLFCIHTYL